MRRVSKARAAISVAIVALSTMAFSAPAGAATGPGGSVIVCTVRFNNPHGSTHVGGTVNSSVDTSCTAPMGMLKSFIRLQDLTNHRSNPLGGSTTYGSSINYGNSSLTCLPGTYQSTGVVEQTFPPGYVPNFQVVEGGSKALGIPCSGASRSAPDLSAPDLSALKVPDGADVRVLADGSIEVTITATKD